MDMNSVEKAAVITRFINEVSDAILSGDIESQNIDPKTIEEIKLLAQIYCGENFGASIDFDSESGLNRYSVSFLYKN